MNFTDSLGMMHKSLVRGSGIAEMMLMLCDPMMGSKIPEKMQGHFTELVGHLK